jgi:hypothetical protein
MVSGVASNGAGKSFICPHLLPLSFIMRKFGPFIMSAVIEIFSDFPHDTAHFFKNVVFLKSKYKKIPKIKYSSNFD